MFSREEFKGINELSNLGDEDLKRTIDFLSETLKYGEQIQKDKYKSDEEKKLILDEIRSKANESIIKQLEIQEELKNTCSQICNLKIQVQNGEDAFNEKLTILMNVIKSFGNLKSTVKRFDLVDQLQRVYLKNITNIILKLRDFTLRPVRSNELSDNFTNVQLNQTEFDQVLDVIGKEINQLHNDVISSVNKLESAEKMTNFPIFKSST